MKRQHIRGRLVWPPLALVLLVVLVANVCSRPPAPSNFVGRYISPLTGGPSPVYQGKPVATHDYLVLVSNWTFWGKVGVFGWKGKWKWNVDDNTLYLDFDASSTMDRWLIIGEDQLLDEDGVVWTKE